MDNFSKQIYEAGIDDDRAEGKAKYIKNLMTYNKLRKFNSKR